MGRPPTGAESVHLRVLPDQWAAIDAWISKQKDPALSRPEAIRRLVELALKMDLQTLQDLKEAKSHAAKAKKLAAELGLKVKAK